MSRIVALLLVLGSLVVMMAHRGSVDAEEKDAPKPRKDSLGDPLPPAAVTRIGSLRFVHGGEVSHLVFSKDDKTLYSVGAGMVRVWDVATGKERRSYPVKLGHHPILSLAVSPDARFLACGSADGTVSFRDLETGKAQVLFATEKKLPQALSFGPSGTIAWISTESTIHLTDWLGDRKTRLLKSTPESFSRTPLLSLDGKLIATHTEEGIVLWDTVRSKRIRLYPSNPARSFRWGDRGGGRFCFDPEAKVLFSSDQRGVVALETDSIEERYRIQSDQATVSFDLSPDGKTLAVILQNGHIRLYQAQSGKAINHLEAKTAPQLSAFSRDGKTLACTETNGRIRLWDTVSAKEKAINPGETISVAGFGKQGREIVTGSRGKVTHWSLQGKLGRQVSIESANLDLLSPCGRYALARAKEGTDSHLIDTEKGEARKDFSGPKGASGDRAVFHPTGQSVAVLNAQESNLISLYSCQTGKKSGQLKLAENPLTTSTMLAFSPDGRTLFTSHAIEEWSLRWELATGKQRSIFRFPGSGSDYPDVQHLLGGNGRIVFFGGRWRHHGDVSRGYDFVLSPDGRFLAYQTSGQVSLCDIATSTVEHRFTGPASPDTLAFSPDGKYLVASTTEHQILFWDVATGKLVSTLSGHRGTITSLVFSPDGKHLLTAAHDGTALLWSVAEALRLPQPQPPKHTPRTPEQAWSDLASDDAAIAELAIADLAAKPDESVKLLTKHLRPAPAVERGRLDKLIQQLDHEEQSMRDEASRQLTALDEQARTVVEAATKSASVEMRRRAEAILARLNRLERTGAEARPVRAVEALERIGTPAAKKLMTEWSRGAADARLTNEATSALQRMRE